MYGNYTVTNELLKFWSLNTPEMYATRFFDASITIMATVGGFSPSQSHGIFLGSGVRHTGRHVSSLGIRNGQLGYR